MTSRAREVYGTARSMAGKVRRRAARLGRPTVPADAPRPPRPTGRPPEVTFERTHLGPAVDRAVYEAKSRLRLGVDPGYDLLYEHFDVLHYLLQRPDLLDEADVDVLEHFLENGYEHGLSPHPDFSMSAYVGRYPRKATSGRHRSPYLRWIRRGRAAGEIADPAPRLRSMAEVLGMPAEEVASLLAARRRDLQERFRTGRLGEMMARATEIEPLIGATWTEIANPKILPFSTPVVVDELTAIYRAQEAAGFRRARLVLVLNRGRWGGGRRMEGHLAHALTNHVDAGDIVVIHTDDSTPTPPGRYPDGVREIDFAALTAKLSPERAQHALVLLLRTFHADAVVNINSRMLHHAMRAYGRALTATERVFPVFFCNEQTAMGTWEGWSLRYFYRAFEDVAGVITDSAFLADELARTYHLSEKHRRRLHVFRAPVDTELPVVTTPPASDGRRPQVFWAGRWDRQKRVDLLLEVARLMPDVDFRMWGEPVMGEKAVTVPTNVSVEGRYDHISRIPLAEADAWLYTSAWDGVPSQLLEVAMTGIPLVGSLVGGTGEVLHEGCSWPVPVDGEAPAYVAALRQVLADPGEARRRALALRERMLTERTEKEFAAHAAEVLLVGEADQEAHP